MKHKVADLEGALLDAAVARAVPGFVSYTGDKPPPYSTNWALGGLLIERERIMLGIHRDNWSAYTRAGTGVGPTPLIAAMRAYAASKFGEEVELP